MNLNRIGCTKIVETFIEMTTVLLFCRLNNLYICFIHFVIFSKQERMVDLEIHRSEGKIVLKDVYLNCMEHKSAKV